MLLLDAKLNCLAASYSQFNVKLKAFDLLRQMSSLVRETELLYHMLMYDEA